MNANMFTAITQLETVLELYKCYERCWSHFHTTEQQNSISWISLALKIYVIIVIQINLALFGINQN